MLFQEATNRNNRIRASAMWALGEIRSRPEVAIPILTNGLTDPDGSTQLSAVHALGKFGPAAQSAIPLLNALTQRRSRFDTLDLQIQIEALKALAEIPSTNSPLLDPLSGLFSE